MQRKVKIEHHFLAVDYKSVQDSCPKGVSDEMYRRLMLTGASYSERDLREWVNNTWGERAGPMMRGANHNPECKLTSPLEVIIRSAAKGGWLIYETIGMDVTLQ